MDRLIEFPQDQQQQPEKPAFRPDDDQIAAEVATEWQESVAFYYGEWRKYEGGCWRHRDIHEVRGYLRKFLRRFRQNGVQVTQRRISSLAQMLEDDLFIPDRTIIERQAETQKYLNMRNGLFNLETMQMEAHRQDLYFSTQFDFDYDPEADAPNFLKYVRSSLVQPGTNKPDEELIFLVMEAIGYSLTARTDLKASFWLVGKPDSGKSTLVKMLKDLFGSLHGTIDLTQLGANRFMLSEIVGKRVVTFTENSAHNVLPDALYKALVGGTDEIYADVKNRPGIAFVPEAKLWWGMNEKPRIVDRSGATFNRLYIIPFNRTIPQHERIGNLDSLLYQERSGILNWALVGYKRLLRQLRFTMPLQSSDLREKYRQENDTEQTFVDECCERHPDHKIQSDALFQAYRMWCERNGFKNKNRNQMNGEWERLGFYSRKSSRMYWHGVKLLNEWNKYDDPF